MKSLVGHSWMYSALPRLLEAQPCSKVGLIVSWSSKITSNVRLRSESFAFADSVKCLGAVHYFTVTTLAEMLFVALIKPNLSKANNSWAGWIRLQFQTRYPRERFSSLRALRVTEACRASNPVTRIVVAKLPFGTENAVSRMKHLRAVDETQHEATAFVLSFDDDDWHVCVVHCVRYCHSFSSSCHLRRNGLSGCYFVAVPGLQLPQWLNYLNVMDGMDAPSVTYRYLTPCCQASGLYEIPVLSWPSNTT